MKTWWSGVPMTELRRKIYANDLLNELTIALKAYKDFHRPKRPTTKTKKGK